MEIIEFDDGSEWTLSKCLTHANRTFDLLKNRKWCTGELMAISYLKVREINPLYIMIMTKRIVFALRC